MGRAEKEGCWRLFLLKSVSRVEADLETVAPRELRVEDECIAELKMDSMADGDTGLSRGSNVIRNCGEVGSTEASEGSRDGHQTTFAERSGSSVVCKYVCPKRGPSRLLLPKHCTSATLLRCQGYC